MSLVVFASRQKATSLIWAASPGLTLLALVPWLCERAPTVRVYGPLPLTADTVTVSALGPVSSLSWSLTAGAAPEVTVSVSDVAPAAAGATVPILVALPATLFGGLVPAWSLLSAATVRVYGPLPDTAETVTLSALPPESMVKTSLTAGALPVVTV